MVERNLKIIISKAKEVENIVIVGGGKNGRGLLLYLDVAGCKATHVFDNKETLVGTMMRGITVEIPF